MDVHSTVVITAPLTLAPDVGKRSQCDRTIGRINRQLLEQLTPEWTTPTFEVVPHSSKVRIPIGIGRWATEQNGELSGGSGKGTIHPEFFANQSTYGQSRTEIDPATYQEWLQSRTAPSNTGQSRCTRHGLKLTALRLYNIQPAPRAFNVGSDSIPWSEKSVLELCWETCTRVQYLTPRIALYQHPQERIEKSFKFHYFLIRVAGIAGGPVAESKAMDPRNDRRVRDYLAEAECPNYLIENITLSESEEDSVAREAVGNGFPTSKKPARKRDTPSYYGGGFVFLGKSEWEERNTKTSNHVSEVQLRAYEKDEPTITPYDMRWRALHNVRTNWCPTCKEYVPNNHDAAGGIPCERYIAKRENITAKWRAQSVPVFPRNDPNKPSWKDGPINPNGVEDRWIACIDRQRGHSQSCVDVNQPVNHKPRKAKRHYVRHGADDLSFVRQQDSNLATEL
jgi:hypothetical protein